jgi:hypothetical protein
MDFISNIQHLHYHSAFGTTTAFNKIERAFKTVEKMIAGQKKKEKF